MKSAEGAEALYADPISSGRSGPLYNAFSYPTKIDPETVALFIAAHTKPGDTVLDVFAGSGTTGLGALLCERPTKRMRQRVSELGLQIEWGSRNAVLYELSTIGALLSKTLCTPPDPNEFQAAADRIVASVMRRYGWIYNADSPEGARGSIRHTIWTEVLECQYCRSRHTFWELAVKKNPLAIRSKATCPSCKAEVSTADAERVTEEVEDPLTRDVSSQRVRSIAHIYGRSGRAVWQRPPQASDLELFDRVLQEPLSSTVPLVTVEWGDLYRSGYHHGIKHIHEFYTRRNLIALGAFWETIEKEKKHLQDALRLLVLSYNASHSTLMTRVVVKKNMSDFVLTGAQSGVLYISSLPVEKNIFEGVARKARVFRDAFATTYNSMSTIDVINASSTHLKLENRSIDYVFTDPPFGDFIPYSEINQLNEAWLGSTTQKDEEVIVSRSQGKGVAEYGSLMKDVFLELSRVLRHDGLVTVIFHSSRPAVWSAVGDAFSESGLRIEATSVLDKTQVSFKQAVSEGSTRGDAIFLLSLGGENEVISSSEGKNDLRAIIGELRQWYGVEISPQHLYSRYVARCVESGSPVVASANQFYDVLKD